MVDPAKPADAESKDGKWWHSVGWGVLALALAVYSYYDLTKFEQEGGWRRMKWLLALAYNTLGKWGVVGLLVVLGVVLVGYGVLRKTRKTASP